LVSITTILFKYKLLKKGKIRKLEREANISIRIENMKTLRAQNSSSESKPLFRKLASEIEEPEISDTVPPYTER